MSSKRTSVANLFQQAADPLSKLMIAMTGQNLQGLDKTVWRIQIAYHLPCWHQDLHSSFNMRENMPAATERAIADANQEVEIWGAMFVKSIQGADPQFLRELCRSLAKVRKLIDRNLDANKMQLAIMLLLRPKTLEHLRLTDIAGGLAYTDDLAPLRRLLKNAKISFAPGRRGRPKLIRPNK